MRKPDVEVREVVCSETGKPMPKIPLWMADISVKFVSDEARQKHPTTPGIADMEPLRRTIAAAPADVDDAKAVAADDIDEVDEAIEEDEDVPEEGVQPQ